MSVRTLLVALPLGLLLVAGAPSPSASTSPAPSAERDRALSALNAARNAARQLEEDASGDARSQLAEAERLFSAGQYADAAARADEAWRRMSDSNPQGTKFRIEVDEAGKTKVSAQSGGAVRVEARGVERTVHAGQVLQVAPGEVPSEPREPVPTPPVPLAIGPAEGAVLGLGADKAGKLGPVKLSWRRSEGAKGYVIEVVAEAEGAEPLVVKAQGASVELPRLAAGAYRWTVRAVGADEVEGEPSAPRRFRLEAETMRLDVRGTGWK